MDDTEVQTTRLGGFGRGVLNTSKQTDLSAPGRAGMSSGFGKPSGDSGSKNGFGSSNDQPKHGGFGGRGGSNSGVARGGFSLSGNNTEGDSPPKRGGFGSSGDNTNTNSFGSKRGGLGGGNRGFGSRGDNEGDSSSRGGFGGGGGGFGSSGTNGDGDGPKRGGFGGGGGRGGLGSRGGFGGSGTGDRPPRGGGFGSTNGEKKSDGCFKCGESGHFSRECPNAGSGGGGGGDKSCFKCGEAGHFSRECPSAGRGGGGGGDRNCFKCGESGHFSRECPNAAGSGGDGITLDKERPPPYVPPAPSEDEEEIFKSITKGINFDNFDKIPAEVTGKDPPAAINSFDEAGLYDAFLANVRKSKYEKPTPVQKHAIPIIMAGRDLMACAQTGSGKTAAFLLPTLTRMMKNGLTGSSFSAVQEPQALVVAPTRELAVQICRDTYKFAHGTMLKSVVLYGGTSLGHQLRQVEKGCHLLVGTPGRLIDIFGKGKVSLEKIQYLILDEADRMLDMGFGPEIKKIIEAFGMPGKGQRQTLMFSATFPEEIQKLAAEYLNEYLFLSIGFVGGASSDVSQHIFEVDRMAKREKLVEILSEEGTSKTLVFVEQKRNADFLAAYLSQTGFPTTSIHGDRLQQEREEALADFKAGRAYILVATSVAARGLDIPAVKHVINYDLPAAIDEYVHRIGRTGRCGNLGKATSFYDNSSDSGMAKALVKILKQACQVIPDWLDNYAQGSISTAGYVPMNTKFGGKDIRKNMPKTRTEGETPTFGGGFSGGFNTGMGGGGSSAFDANDEESWD